MPTALPKCYEVRNMTTLASPDICLRPEHPGESDDIRHVTALAFEREAEADLIDALRASGAVTLSAVALLGATAVGTASTSASERGELCTGQVHGGEVVGHVLFAPVSVTTDRGEIPLLSLATVAVLPEHQHHGIGTMLVSGSLEYLRSRGHQGVIVIGGLDFYRRFGFIQADRWGIQNELDIPDEAFLALSLTPGVLGGVSGVVRYPPEFEPVLSR